MHGLTAAGASSLALFFARLAAPDNPLLPAGFIDYLAPITAGFVGASIGTVLCTTCRHRLAPVKRLSRPFGRAARRRAAEAQAMASYAAPPSAPDRGVAEAPPPTAVAAAT